MMRNTINLEKLCKDLTYTLMTKLTAKKMAILLVEEESPFVIIGAQEGFDEATLALSSNNPLIEYFNIQGIQKELLVYNEITKQSEEDPSDRDLTVLIREMEKLDVTLVGPIYIKGRLIGLFFLDDKRSEDIYTEDEFSMLEIIFSQAGTSIENARLYKRVQEQMEELKKNQSEQLMQSAKLASVGELAVSVAHEINNPLTGILGFTSLLLSEMPPEDPRNERSESHRERGVPIPADCPKSARFLPLTRLQKRSDRHQRRHPKYAHPDSISGKNLQHQYRREVCKGSSPGPGRCRSAQAGLHQPDQECI
ncbi:MAG: hypothetical protein MPW15_13555 [Candidatus Manganitrophus sp.]|nr:hypothetical protein [Candidatus Manganitrophus sp.]